jgi:hypothetical protein
MFIVVAMNNPAAPAIMVPVAMARVDGGTKV